MNKARKQLAFVLCLALAMSLCACGSTDAYVPTGDALSWDEDYTGQVYTQPQQEQQQELTLTYYPDRSLNPYTCTDYTNRALFSLLYQSLFTVDRSYNVEPLLCKSYTVSDDMTVYTFYIEQATFSDGSLLTAEDVAESIKAAAASTVYKGRFYRLSDVSVTDDGGVRLKLNTPYENFPILLDIPILPADQLSEEKPMGTGPYILDTAGHAAVLRRRTDWWCAPEMAVTASTITLLTAESTTQIRDEFQFGDLSLVCADPSSDRYVDFRNDFELWDCENGAFVYLACNSASAVFSDPEVRSALTFAIDRETLNTDHYRGFARPASLPASPLSPYYSQSLAQRYGYEEGKFSSVLESKGLTGSAIVLLVNSDDSLRTRVGRSVKAMLEECGLQVTLSALSGKEYKNALTNRLFDIYLGQTVLSANMDLSPFFASSGALRYGGLNDVTTYTLCMQALENHGNYYTLHKTVMDDGMLCPVLFCSYAVYTTRGLLTGLSPSRDNVFYYSLGKTLDGIRQ